MLVRPLFVDFAGLKAMGWPYCRVHTFRLMEKERIRSKGSHRKGTYREWVEPNPYPFPTGYKLGEFRNSAYVWRVADVLAYFEHYGLPVTADWYNTPTVEQVLDDMAKQHSFAEPTKPTPPANGRDEMQT